MVLIESHSRHFQSRRPSRYIRAPLSRRVTGIRCASGSVNTCQAPYQAPQLSRLLLPSSCALSPHSRALRDAQALLKGSAGDAHQVDAVSVARAIGQVVAKVRAVDGDAFTIG